MRTLRFLLEKEFRQIFRNPAILRLIFVMPAVQLILLPMAADYEVKNVEIAIVDQDHSPMSRELIAKIDGSQYFELTEYSDSYEKSLETVELDKADLVLQIPPNFEKNLIKENESTLFIAVNAINGVKANLGNAYLANLIRQYNMEVRLEWMQLPKFNPFPMIEITHSNWYNPFVSYPLFMVPGILTILLTMVGGFLAALNIVREKEIGTIEQLNVTPIKKYHLILGKMIPFWLLGFVVLTIGFLISYLIYGIVPVGSLVTIYVFAALYLFGILGFGLFISTLVETQQQAMLFGFFFMLIFILMSGLYTPIESMPDWARLIAELNPVTYFVEVMRMVVLKGSTLHDITRHLVITGVFAIFLNGIAIWNYRKRG
ncbi:MAG: ABC transporter permease [Saprospiraceae bacterium]|nr:ABC transporter permease [Saprospiraceae bacterium]